MDYIIAPKVLGIITQLISMHTPSCNHIRRCKLSQINSHIPLLTISNKFIQTTKNNITNWRKQLRLVNYGAGNVDHMHRPYLEDWDLQTIPPSCQQHEVENPEKSDMLTENPRHILDPQPSGLQPDVVLASPAFPTANQSNVRRMRWFI